MAEDKLPPADLPPHLVRQLLDHLENDAAFRQRFQASPEQALRALGYSGPVGCMTLKDGATLASPEQIRAQRAKLEAAMTGIQKAECILSNQTAG